MLNLSSTSIIATGRCCAPASSVHAANLVAHIAARAHLLCVPRSLLMCAMFASLMFTSLSAKPLATASSLHPAAHATLASHLLPLCVSGAAVVHVAHLACAQPIASSFLSRLCPAALIVAPVLPPLPPTMLTVRTER
jgi:hypothetical protein